MLILKIHVFFNADLKIPYQQLLIFFCLAIVDSFYLKFDYTLKYCK